MSAKVFDLETLAQRNGQLAPPAVDGGKYLWRHRVASYLHGWELYEYHRGAVMLAESDYLAALAAVDTQTTHPAAVRKS